MIIYIKDEVIKLIEVTSKTAQKKYQQQHENRVRDAGGTPIPKKQVYRHFQIIFDFLKAKELLTEEGIEDAAEPRGYEDIFWNEQVKPIAHPFFHEYYDALISSAEYGSAHKSY